MLPSTIKYKKFTSQRRFGVELETGDTLTKAKVKKVLKQISDRKSTISSYRLSEESQGWHIKDDATCGPLGRQGPQGVEIVSFVAKGIKDLQHIAEVADFLYEAGSRSNQHCGLHIHAEACDLSPKNVGTLLAYWLKIEPILSIALPSFRWANPYCIQMRHYYYPVLSRRFSSGEKLWHEMKPGNIGYYENIDRRVSLNLVNYARALHYGTNYRKTLELRWPEGTLNSRDIKCWVRLFLGFIESCKNRPMPEDFLPATLDETLTYLGLNHEEDSFTIFSEGLHDTKTWFLERIIHFAEEHKNPLTYAPMESATIDLMNKVNACIANEAKEILNLMWFPIKKYD